jgi:hypothetical protein
VQDLQRDAPAGLRDGVDDAPVRGDLLLPVEHRRGLVHRAFGHRRVAAAQQQAGLAARPRGVEGCQALVRAIERLQACVHRAHDDAVGQGKTADDERREQVEEAGHGMARGRGSEAADGAAGTG